MTDVCIKDQEIETSDEISVKCDGANEYIVKCDAKNYFGYSCSLTSDGTQYKISGLKHSGVIQTDATTTITTTTTSSSGSSSTTRTIVTNSTTVQPEATLYNNMAEEEPNLISYNQPETRNEDSRGKSIIVLIIGGAIVLIIVYGIFHMIEHYEMRKFRLKQRPIVSKKRK
jgi:hypothetical protein